MPNSPQDRTKRNLIIATTAVGAVGAVATAVPFMLSMSPSERAKAAGAPVETDISKLQLGQLAIVEWRQQPVWVLRRTPEMIAEMKKIAGELADPNSDGSEQPDYCKNETRSIKPDLFVGLGICTHLGCSPVKREAEDAEMRGAGDGFYCPCHGSRFDLAARVFKGSPAPSNLTVPPHKYLNDTTILIGDDTKGA